MFEFDAAEIVMIGSGAGIGRGVRAAVGRVAGTSALLAADLRLRLDFWLGLRARVEERMERWPWLPSSSDHREVRIFSPIRGWDETGGCWMGDFALVRAFMADGAPGVEIGKGEEGKGKGEWGTRGSALEGRRGRRAATRPWPLQEPLKLIIYSHNSTAH